MKVEEIKENGKKVIEKHKQKILIAGATITAFTIGVTVGRKFGLLEVGIGLQRVCDNNPEIEKLMNESIKKLSGK